MKKLLLLILLALSGRGEAQSRKTLVDTLADYFKELKTATFQHQDLWKKDLYGPVLLVDPLTRMVFANTRDATGQLKINDKLFSGTFPQEKNIANTSVNWNGTDWAMVLLPLPLNKEARINLLAHELFHRSQPSLGFKLSMPDNNHLDQKNGRIYLRLELEALKKALQSASATERRAHTRDALIFRKYRYQLFPGADSLENSLELNEGLAEYSGLVLSSRTTKNASDHLVNSINDFFKNPTYVRSFAYQTIPAYGFLLSKNKPLWNRDISTATNLSSYFIGAFNFSIPTDVEKNVQIISNFYDGDQIAAEENTREDNHNKQVADYKQKFLELPHLEIPFEQMNISYDPGNIVALEDKGSVYPNLRISDKWGILTVTNGALVSAGWEKVSVSLPVNIDSTKINGDGWTLLLNPGYKVLNKNDGNYLLSKE